MSERAVSKNERMSLIRVFGGRPYKVAIKDPAGTERPAMDYLFASSPEDARDQAREAFPEVGADMFVVSEVAEEPRQCAPSCG